MTITPCSSGYQGTSCVSSTALVGQVARRGYYEMQMRAGHPPTGFEDATGQAIWLAAKAGDKGAIRERKIREALRHV